MFKVLLLASVAALAFGQKYGPYGPGPAYYDDYAQPIPYDFGYDVAGDYGDTHFRKESGDGHGRVQGSYGYTDPQGTHRVVEYVADEHGFRPVVRTNEPGTANQNPADTLVQSDAHPVPPQLYTKY